MPAGARLPIDIRRFPWIRRLAADYAFDYARVADFFAGNPADPAAWRDAIARTQQHRAPARARSPISLQAQQRSRGAPGRRISAAAQLRDPQTVAIVTGQQAGLFGGPLFTLLKAITAHPAGRAGARRARRAGRRGLLDRRRRSRLGRGQGVRRARRRAEAARRSPPAIRRTRTTGPVAARAAGRLGERAIERTRSGAAGDRVHARLLDGFAGPMRPARAWPTPSAAGSRRCSARAGSSSTTPPTRPPSRWSPTCSRAKSSTPGETARLAAEAGAALEARGYHAQVTPQEGSLALFHLNAGRAADQAAAAVGFLVGERSESTAALLERVRDAAGGVQPERAAAAPVQDTLFPTVCYVAGPERAGLPGSASTASTTRSASRCR